MALSKSFFTLRRGSTKSLTFQTYRGQQVTKDRVSEVKNPQSSAQMSQRLVVPMVASARASLKGLVDHSFEGTAYGWQSLQKFSSLNLRKGALTVTQYVPKGAMDCGEADFIVSRGSLPQNTYFAGALSDKRVRPALGLVPYPGFRLELAGTTPTAEELETFVRGIFLNGNTNAMVSFLYANRGASYTWDANGNNYTAYRHPWWLWRIDGSKTFDDLLIDLSYTAGDTSAINLRFDEDLVLNIGVTATTNSETNKVTLSIRSTTAQIDEATKEYHFTAGLAEGYDDTPFAMFAMISSELQGNVWKRSSQKMAIISSNIVSADQVLPTYMNSSASVHSDYFLNEGDKSTYISGNGGTGYDDSNDGGEKTQG